VRELLEIMKIQQIFSNQSKAFTFRSVCAFRAKYLIAAIAVALLSGGATAQTNAPPPVLKDAYKDHFYVGVAISRAIATGVGGETNKVNGVIRNMDELQRDIALVKEQFNLVVPENDLKWERVHPREGADGYDFGPADAFVRFGLANQLYLVGHTLVWYDQTPDWVFQTNAPASVPRIAGAGRGRFGRSGSDDYGGGNSSGGPSKPRATREELLQRMHDHIATVVGRYKGKIKVWDVVNEATADEQGAGLMRNTPWLQIIGPDYIAKAFEYAHEADPDAILRFNDDGLENAAKRHKLIALIKSLQEQHVPVMAIGSQTHVSVSSPSFEEEDQALTELETLGLPIHITELDVKGDAGGQSSTETNAISNAGTAQGAHSDDASVVPVSVLTIDTIWGNSNMKGDWPLDSRTPDTGVNQNVCFLRQDASRME
jgi:endo-1,4-beta-xylanase